MNYKLLLYISVACVLLSACQKESDLIPQVSKTSLNGTPILADGSYQPVTLGSTWKYTATISGSANEITQTMSGNTTTINSKRYFEVNGISSLYGNMVAYFQTGNNIYTQRSTTVINGITIEMLYLDANKAINETWTAPLTDNGLVNGVPGRVIGKIVEKDISYTVMGKVFGNVIHTKLDLQYDINGFETIFSYDFFIARGVGIIEINTYASNMMIASTKLSSYTIK